MFDERDFDNLEFTLDLREYPVKFLLNGESLVYYMREMTGQQRDEYLSALQKMMGSQVMSGGKVNPAAIKSFDGIEAELLTRVIFKDEKDDEGESKRVKVSKKEIQGWPALVQHKLFLKAQKLTGLGDDEQDKKDQEEAKND